MQCSYPIARRLLLTVLVLGGCAGALEDPERFWRTHDGAAPDAQLGQRDGGRGELEARALAILGARCTGCHSAAARLGGLDLMSADVGARLASATVTCAELEGRPMIDAAAPASSYFLAKLSDSPPCGTPMPQASARLTADELAVLTAWVGSL